jgi:hypothetical protein
VLAKREGERGRVEEAKQLNKDTVGVFLNERECCNVKYNNDCYLVLY